LLRPGTQLKNDKAELLMLENNIFLSIYRADSELVEESSALILEQVQDQRKEQFTELYSDNYLL
jgi:hypothetical protein